MRVFMDDDGQTFERPPPEINLAQWVKRLINIKYTKHLFYTNH